MTTFLKTFGIFILIFIATFAILYFFGIAEIVLALLISWIAYRLLKENGI